MNRHRRIHLFWPSLWQNYHRKITLIYSTDKIHLLHIHLHTFHIFTQNVFKTPVGIKIYTASWHACEGEIKDASSRSNFGSQEPKERLWSCARGWPESQLIQEVISADIIIFLGKAIHLASQSSINQQCNQSWEFH